MNRFYWVWQVASRHHYPRIVEALSEEEAVTTYLNWFKKDIPYGKTYIVVPADGSRAIEVKRKREYDMSNTDYFTWASEEEEDM